MPLAGIQEGEPLGGCCGAKPLTLLVHPIAQPMTTASSARPARTVPEKRPRPSASASSFNPGKIILVCGTTVCGDVRSLSSSSGVQTMPEFLLAAKMHSPDTCPPCVRRYRSSTGPTAIIGADLMAGAAYQKVLLAAGHPAPCRPIPASNHTVATDGAGHLQNPPSPEGAKRALTVNRARVFFRPPDPARHNASARRGKSDVADPLREVRLRLHRAV